MPAAGPPFGLLLARTSRRVGRGFADALAAEEGSLPMWLALTALASGERLSQRDLAARMWIEGPTLVRHLDNFEQAGLVTRARDARDRRVARLAITSAGRAQHRRLLKAVRSYNAELLRDVDETDLDVVRRVLEQLERNV